MRLASSNVVFADTSFYIAATALHDELHQRADEWMQSFSGRVVMTDFVVVELANFFSRAAQRAVFAATYDYLSKDAQVEIIPLNRPLLDRGLALYFDRVDKNWSLTDCISFVVMRDRGVTDALTADHHFEQAGFVALLCP